MAQSEVLKGDGDGLAEKSAKEGSRSKMPTLTLTEQTLEALGIVHADIVEPVLPANAKRLLEALLVSRGFERDPHGLHQRTGEWEGSS
jgi:hypothetical protein